VQQIFLLDLASRDARRERWLSPVPGFDAATIVIIETV